MSECVFCRIVARKVPASIVQDDGDVLAFRDLNPQAPVHLVLIPKSHIASVSDVTMEQAPIVGQLLGLANRLAKQAGLMDSGYRLVINCGSGAGQSVFHLHLHLLGGRPFRWPPG